MLLLDVGNSRIKWVFVKNGVRVQQGALGNSEWLALQREFARLPPPRRILISNVAGVAMAQRLRSVCGIWPVPVEFITAQAEQCGVVNSYQVPSELGSDRWASLIAAWRKLNGTCLVVNCGTATTVDALSAEGKFLGGLILPGIRLMQRSLSTSTALQGEQGGQLQDFPCATDDAIYSGVLRATLGAVRHQYELLGLPGATCLLSGGAADELQDHLDIPLQRIDNLVLGGLQIIGETD